MHFHTRHPQTEIIMPATCELVEVDEALADILIDLNCLGFTTTFSCQGDKEEPYGYISFSPRIKFDDETRKQVQKFLGITDVLPIDDPVILPDSYRYWSPPWDGRKDGGRMHGWAIYFCFLGLV